MRMTYSHRHVRKVGALGQVIQAAALLKTAKAYRLRTYVVLCLMTVSLPSRLGADGDVAGPVVVGEGLPERVGLARLADPAAVRDVVATMFGYPGIRSGK